MNKVKMLILLTRADRILQQQIYAIKNDEEYPLVTDIKEISIAKSALDEAELLLNSENEKTGEEDGK